MAVQNGDVIFKIQNDGYKFIQNKNNILKILDDDIVLKFKTLYTEVATPFHVVLNVLLLFISSHKTILDKRILYKWDQS